MITVIVALGGLADEADLVRTAAPSGVEVLRRCVDAVDLLAATAADARTPVVLSSGLARLTPEVLARLGDRTVIGLAADSLGRERLSRMGVDPIIDVAPSAAVTMQQVGDVCRARASKHGSTGTSMAPPREAAETGADSSRPRLEATPPEALGRLVAVWGPQGAPGRTTVAIGLAEAWSDRRRRVCLVDADTYAPSITMALGLVEPTSGLAAACRLAEAGTLSATGAVSLTMEITPHWRVLGGLERVPRWSEVRSTATDRLWPVLRQAFDVIVVDIGFCLEVDSTPGAWARQRNGVAASALAHADHVIAVAEDSALGAARLLAAVEDLGAAAERSTTTVVRNRASRGGAGWRAAVAPRLPGVALHDIPEDARVMRAAWEHSTGVRRVAARSRAARALDDLAQHVMPCRVTDAA